MRHRIFIAITPPPVIKKKLTDVIEQLEKLNLPIKTTAANNIHLTLRFLDSLNKKEIKLIDGKLKELFAVEKKFSLDLSSVKLFPSEKNAKVVSADLEYNINLFKLEDKIRKSLCEFRFLPDENRSFHAHITLARITNSFLEKDINRIVDIPIRGSWKVELIELLESDLSGKIPHYVILESYRLNE